ncbi:MAG: sensor histidine kinase [Proteobacteria bacterium]|nr:sensor histidine kinase [Pseudomonadota bacterium]
MGSRRDSVESPFGRTLASPVMCHAGDDSRDGLRRDVLRPATEPRNAQVIIFCWRRSAKGRSMEVDATADPAGALLREVDHRVKNNLQMISSLIQLQARRTSDEAVRAALRTVLCRVAAVSTVHRRLFQGDPHHFEVEPFVRDLATDLAAQAGRDDIEIVLELEPVTLAANAAAPFALVANELIDNALRHAFPPGRGGRALVRLSGGDRCRLVVADDGVGLAAQPDGFGLTVVRLLCRQLHAELALEDAWPGLRCTLTAPLPAGG